MKNILIPTDFSENANTAFLHALKIANKLDSNVFVLHAHQSPILSSSHAGQPDVLANVYEEISLSNFDLFKKHSANLHQLAEENQLDHRKVIFLFEEGSLVDSVRNAVAKEHIDLIVMGTLGASGFQKEFIGTNTVSIIRNTKIPVLCIPSKAELTDINKIAFTTLFREQDRSALTEIMHLAESFDAEVLCTHVMHEYKSPADILQYSNDWGKAFKDKKLEFIFLEKENSVEETIQQFIAENKIDLLAVVKRNRNFFDRLASSSLSNNLAFHATTPVLVFHEEKLD